MTMHEVEPVQFSQKKPRRNCRQPLSVLELSAIEEHTRVGMKSELDCGPGILGWIVG